MSSQFGKKHDDAKLQPIKRRFYVSRQVGRNWKFTAWVAGHDSVQWESNFGQCVSRDEAGLSVSCSVLRW